MENLLNYLLEATLGISIVAMVFLLTLRNEKSYSFNRWFILVGSLIALMAPLLSFSLMPGFNNSLSEFGSNLVEVLVLEQADEAINSISFWTSDKLMLFLYASGVLFFACRWIYQSRKLRYLMSKLPKTFQASEGYYLVPTHGAFPTSSFLNYLFWDEQECLSSNEAERIRQHELAHIRGGHSWDLLWIEALKIVFWFNPFIYVLHHQLRLVHEYLADEWVLTQCQAHEYQQLMLKQLFRVSPVALSHPFNQSQLFKRMKMMTTNKPIQVWKLLVATGTMVIAFTLIACEDPELMVKEDVKVEGEIFQVVDNPGSFPGGQDAFARYLKKHLNYPSEALDDHIQGVVYVQFVITKDGKITEPHVAKGVDPTLDNEALRVVSLMPDWDIPTQYGQPVNQMMMVPIRFAISGNEEEPNELPEIIEDIVTKN